MKRQILATWTGKLAVTGLLLTAIFQTGQAGSVFQTVTNNADSGPGSLRAAIQAANGNGSGGAIIQFAIGSSCGPNVITLTTALPNITEETHILGNTQPGYSANDLDVGDDANICVILDGGTNSITDGLTVPASVADSVKISAIGVAFSGFSHAAINLRGGSNHLVTDIHIGGEVNGVRLDPVGYGIILAPGVHNVTIGGDYTDPSLRNIIGEAINNGIHIDATGASAGPAHDNMIIDNYLGIGYSGSQTQFDRGNGVSGISVGGYNNDIERNYINYNIEQGVHLTGTDSHDNTINYNFIGYQSGRTDAGNGIGVLVDGGSHDNVVDYNSIWDNIGAGVQIVDDSEHISMFDNQYDANGGLGIDLGGDGVTLNSNNSMNAGLPNRDQNFPALTYAAGGHSKGNVSGTLTSTPGTYVVEAFVSLGCDASGYGQGEFDVGSMQITVPNLTVQGQGSVSFTLPIAAYAPLGYSTVTALATDSAGDTSEFSQCFPYTDDTIFANNFELPSNG